MEPAVEELQGPKVGSSNLLDLPDCCHWDSDDEILTTGSIKIKSSPIPRRRSSMSSSSEDDSQPPSSNSRRVSFADAFGLSLVSVKQFDSRSAYDLSDPLEGELNDSKYILNLHFALPLTPEELLRRVQKQKLELESLELLPGTTTLKGTVCVMNLCFHKLVYIRTSLDRWSSHFDLLAEYVSGSNIVDTDRFSFKLTLVPPFDEKGGRVDFCLRYETPSGTFWANNGGQNYVLFCHEKVKEQDENENKHKPKSCLKSTRSNSNTEEIPVEMLKNYGIAAFTTPVEVNEETVKEQLLKLQEENSRNRSRRSRRKAARMAKIHNFAQKEENDLQQMEKDSTTNINVQVPATKETPSDFSTSALTKTESQDITSLPAESSKTVVQTCTASSEDTTIRQVPHAQTQTEQINISVIQPELKSQAKATLTDSLNSRKHSPGCISQALDNSQDNQTVSLTQDLHKSQNSDECISKRVEKAWESIEKGAVQCMGNTSDMSGAKTSHGNNKRLEENKCNFTFTTIVAPLYHQVFERLENNRPELINRTHSLGESVGKLKDGNVRVVTYPSYPRTQSMKPRPSPGISQKHDDYHGTCRETRPQHFTEKAADTELQDSTLPENSQDRNHSEPETVQAVEPTHKALLQLKGPPNVRSWEESALDQAEEMAETILQGENYSVSCPEDPEYLQKNNLLNEGLPETSHHTPIAADFTDLSTSSELDSTVSKQSSSLISENPLSETCPATHTLLNNDTAKIQDNEAQTQTADGAINTSIKGLEKSHIPIPESLFHSDISLIVTPNISVSPELSQNLTQAATQSPDITSGKHKPETTGIIPALLQATKVSRLIQDSDIAHDSTDSHYKGNELHKTPGREKTLIQYTTVTSENPEEPAVDGISANPRHVSEINQKPVVINVNVFDEVIDLKGSDNKYKSDSPEKGIDICEENEQTVYVRRNEEQVSTGIKENPTEKMKDVEELYQKEEAKEEEKEEEGEAKTELQKQEENINVEPEHKNTYSGEDEAQEELKEKCVAKCEFYKDVLPQENKEDLEDDQDLLHQQNIENHKTEKDLLPQQHLKEWENGQGLLPQQNIEESENAKDPLLQQNRKECRIEKNSEEWESEEELLLQQNIKDWEDDQDLQTEQNMEELNNAKDLLPQPHRSELENKKDVLPQQILREWTYDQELLSQQKRQKCENEEELLLQQNMKKCEDQDLLPQQIEKDWKNDQELQTEQNMEELSNAKDLLPQQNIKELKNAKYTSPQQHNKESENDQDLLNQQKIEEWMDDKDLLCQQNIEELENDQKLKKLEDDQSLLSNQTMEQRMDIEELMLQQNKKELENEKDLTLQHTKGIQFNMEYEPQNINIGLEQKTEEPMVKSDAVTEEQEICWKTDYSAQFALTQNNGETLRDSRYGLEIRSEQKHICCQTDKEATAINANDDDDHKLAENTTNNEQTEKFLNDSASTESLSDDEMELCLHRLRTSQQSEFREGISTGKRPFISRTKSISSPMPSISEYINEDQTNVLLDDLTNEERVELERARLPLVDEKDIGSNAMWWREVFSSDNFSTVIVYTFLLVVFLVTAYFWDFIACFGLYLLAVYCLYFQRQREPFKSSWLNKTIN